jgi:uncharacterized protein (DUF2235 family)
MARRLILCLDGTDNSPTSTAKDVHGNPEPVRTNVSRFFRMLVKNDDTQVAYYQPGVGTIDPERSNGKLAKLRNWIGRKYDSLFASMLKSHVLAAYRYLMNHYRDGDEIFLLGFSRGSFTSRVLAGMLHKVGLLYSGQEEMLNFAWQVYAPVDNGQDADRFKTFYCRSVKVRYLGLWDTVSSIGNPFYPTVYPFTLNNESVQTVRHAMAIDERRVMFRQNLWSDSPVSGQDVLQVWFPGVHCDVGGGYTGDSSPWLAGISLAWMIREARAANVQIDGSMEKRLVWPNNVAPPPDLTVEAVTELYATAELHDEIRDHWYWRLIERIPLPRWSRVNGNQWKREFSRHQSAPRRLKSNQGTANTIRVHHSADIRRQKLPDYSPPNLLSAADIPRVW